MTKGAAREDDPPRRKLASALLAFENRCSSEEAPKLPSALGDWLRGPGDDELRQAFVEWVRRALPWVQDLVVAAGLSFALAGAAAAHSRPDATVPEDGEVAAEAPAVIAISFDKPMRVTWIELTDAGGNAFALKRTDEMAPVTRFEAAPPPLPAGRYTVEWRGLSVDGHPMRGRFSFEVRPRNSPRNQLRH